MTVLILTVLIPAAIALAGTAPEIGLNQTILNNITINTTFLFLGNFSDYDDGFLGTEVAEIYVNNSWQPTNTVFNDSYTGNFNYAWNTSSYTDAEYSFRFRINNSLNNQTATSPVNILLDRSPPSVTLIHAPDNLTVSNITNYYNAGLVPVITLTFTANEATFNRTDPTLNKSSTCSLVVNGSVNQTIEVNDVSVRAFNYNITLASNPRPPVTYAWKVNCTDAFGFEGVSETRTFNVTNNTKPGVRVIYPNGGETVSGTVNVTWEATDSDNDTLTVKLYSSDDSGSAWTQITGADSMNDGSENWDTTTVSDSNNYRMKVIATDTLESADSDISNNDFTVENSGTTGGGGDDSTESFGGLGGGDLGDTSGYDVSRIFNLIEPGTPVIVDISHIDLAFTKFTINVARTLGDVRIKIRNMESSPVTVSPAGEIYQYLEVDTTNLPDADVATAIIDFKVPKSWFTGNSLNKDSVKLKRYVSNGWRDLATSFEREDGDYYHYSANTPGFSFFAVVASKVEAAAAVAGETTEGAPPEGTGFLTGITGGSIFESLSSLSKDKIIGIVISAIVIVAFIGLIAKRKIGRGSFKFPKIRMPDASGEPEKKPYSGKYVKLKLKK